MGRQSNSDRGSGRRRVALRTRRSTFDARRQTPDARRWTLDVGRWTLDVGRWNETSGPAAVHFAGPEVCLV
jgi:hypothetical protein